MKYSLFLSAMLLFMANNAFAPTVYDYGTAERHYYPPNSHIKAYDAWTGTVTHYSSPFVEHSVPHYHVSTHTRDYHPASFHRQIPPHMIEGHPSNYYPGYYDDFGNFYYHYRDYRDAIIRTCFFDGHVNVCHY